MEIGLPRKGLILDPRANRPLERKFRVDYHEDNITVTLTRIDDDPYTLYSFYMRVYDPKIEVVPSFDSTIYTYMGQDNERVPKDTTCAIIHSSVKIIKALAFLGCDKMTRCIMHNHGIETLEISAFCGCTSLEALFLPSSLREIEGGVFDNCRNIRILSLPMEIDIENIQQLVFRGCDTLFHTAQIQSYELHGDDDQVHQAVLDFYRNQPPLHKVCLSTDVNVLAIKACIQENGKASASITDHNGMKPLHILAINPHASTLSIYACFEANISAAIENDSEGNNPLDYLREHKNVEGYMTLLRALCLHRMADLKGLGSERKKRKLN